MIAVALETAKIIRGNNRVYSALVSFSFLSCKIPESIKIHAPNAQNGCVPDQMVYPYLHHINNRFFIVEKIRKRIFPTPQNIHANGFLHQVKKRPYTHIGYIGAKADVAGNVRDTITLYIPKTNIKKVTLRTNFDRIIIDAVVRAKDGVGNVLKEFKIQNNSSSELVFDLVCENASVLELKVSKHTASKRIWIVSFYAGFEFLVNEKDIIKIKVTKKKTENKEGSIGRVYINAIEMELNNISRIYDDENKQSPIAGYFNSNAIVSCVLRLKQNENTKPFILHFGTFFVSKIKGSEERATVTVTATDYIGLTKNDYLSLGIFENSNAHEVLSRVANELNLSSIKIENSLKEIKLKRIPLSGTVASILNKMAVLTNSFISVDELGVNLIATPMLSRHGHVRYPARYFFLDEYKTTNAAENKNNSPNVITLSYTDYEYEGEYQAGLKDTMMYANLPALTFPEHYKNTPFHERDVGAGVSPSVTKEYNLSVFTAFVTVEFSDALIPKALEYSVGYEYDTSGKATKATVKIWNFIERNEGEQLTVMVMVMEKPFDTLLKKENFDVPKMPRSYIIPPKATVNPSDVEEVENRNAKNTPKEFTVEMKDAVSISRIEVANVFKPSNFEFIKRETSGGVAVKVWNYVKEKPQTLTVNLYGTRLVASKNKKSITARNADDIQINGEIKKTIEVGSLASDDVAQKTLYTMAKYYHYFDSEMSVQTWSDPRLQLYDLIAFKSLRGYGFKQGIVDELEFEYKGFLTQKIKIKTTKKHNRDCRVASGFVLCDRPVVAQNFLGYA